MEPNLDDVPEAPPLPSNYQCYASLKTLATILKRADMEILLQRMKNSIFYPFLKQLHDLVKEGQKESSFECSSKLMFCLGKGFNVADKTIRIGDVSIKLCANEVARILGIPNEGINIDDIAADDEKEVKKFFSRLEQLKEGTGQPEPSRAQSDKEESDGAKNEDEVKVGTKKKGGESKLNRSNLTSILEKMHVDLQNDESVKEFLVVFKYFLVEHFLLVSADKTLRMKTYKYVQDVDRFEKINWALATLNGIEEAAKKVATSNSCFTCCAPVLEAFLYEKVKAMRPDLRKGGDTLLPILKFSSKRWIYNSVWPELQKLTISNIKIWECENCNTCEVKSLTSQEVKSLETRGPRFPKTRDVDVVNEYSAQVMNVGGDAYVQVLMLGAIEQATSENEELGRYMSYYGPQKIADCLKADLKADSWQLLETLNDNLLGYSSASAQQFVSIDDESVASDLDRKTDIDEAPVVSAAPAAPVVPAADVAPAVRAAAVALAAPSSRCPDAPSPVIQSRQLARI